MQFSKPMYIFIGYFVRLRNDFKAIAYHAVYDIRSVSPLDGEGVTQPLPRLQAKVLVYPRPSLNRLRSEQNYCTFVSNEDISHHSSLDEKQPSCTVYVINLALTK